MNTLIIIAGARSDIGKAYIDYLEKDYKIIGITRSSLDNSKIIQIQSDLT
jgi:short-subunit dehydrogenase